ncbi:MAG: glycosyltransferase [Verrucomicrobiota bacterium]
MRPVLTNQAPPPDRGTRPRVAIIQKSNGLLTWCTDLTAAFREAGATTLAANSRPSSLSEHWARHRNNQRLLLNPATSRRLANTLSGFAPDLVVILNSPSLPPAAEALMRRALRPGVPIVGWLCDSVDVLPAGHDAMLDGVYYFDSASLPTLLEHYRATPARLEFLPLAANPRRYACQPINIQARGRHLVFAGNCTPARQRFFADYRSLGQRLDLYGLHAGNWPRVWRNRKLSSAALARVYQQCLVNLNLLQAGNTTNGLNLRAFEIPCAGGLASYPDVPDLARCFTPDEEVIVYQSATDLAEKVGHLLRHPEQALAITLAGHQRVLREHTFYHRAVRMLNDWLGSSFRPEIPDYIASSL